MLVMAFNNIISYLDGLNRKRKRELFTTAVLMEIYNEILKEI